MAHRITVNDQWFLNMHRRDPLMGKEFELGDNVVVCLDCRCVQTLESWQFNENKCSNCGKTRSTSSFSREFVDFNYGHSNRIQKFPQSRRSSEQVNPHTSSNHRESARQNTGRIFWVAAIILFLIAVLRGISPREGSTQTQETVTYRTQEKTERLTNEGTRTTDQESGRQTTEKAESLVDNSVSTSSSYFLSDSSSRYYSYHELNRLDDDTLQMAINEIYARHGRMFNTPSIREYFESQSWYHGTVEPSEIDGNEADYFNQYELANFKLMVKIRDERSEE